MEKQANRFGSRMYLGGSAGCYKGAAIDVEAPYHEWLTVTQRMLDSHADLLEALKEIVADASCSAYIAQVAETAIAKAEGK